MSLIGGKVLFQGLTVLERLAEAPGPMNATALARTMEMHVSSMTRILSALIEAGYVYKPSYHSYAIALGALSLGSRARAHFPIIEKCRDIICATSRELGGYVVQASALDREHLVVFALASHGQLVSTCSSGAFPLHLSSAGLLLLCGLPASEALARLESHRARQGWQRPTEQVPSTPQDCLDKARSLMRNECLPLADWQEPQRITVAISLDVAGNDPYALATSGPFDETADSLDRIILQLDIARQALLNKLP